MAGTFLAGAAGGIFPRDVTLLAHMALPPIDLFADVRTLMAFAPGHWVFWPCVLAAVAARAAVLAALLGGWDRRRLRFAAAFYGVASIPALVSAFLNSVAHGLLFARTFWVGLALMIVVVVLLAATPWAAGGGSTLWAAWRLTARSGLRAWAVLGYLAALALVSGAVSALGGIAQPQRPGALAPLVGGVIVVVVLTTVTTTHLRSPVVRHRLANLATAGPVVAVLALAMTNGFQLPSASDAAPPQVERDGAVLFMSGIESASGDGAMVEVPPQDIGYPCERTYYFSYAGPGQGQPQRSAHCPIITGAPYDEDDTFRPFDEQVTFLDAQLDTIGERPAVVIGHSQGAWVAWAAAAEGHLDDDGVLVLVGPLTDNVVGAPRIGEPGPGRVPLDIGQFIQPVVNFFGGYIVLDAPLTQDVLLTASTTREIYGKPIPDDLDVLAVPAIEDLALMRSGREVQGAVNACPLAQSHGGLPYDPGLTEQINTFLDTGQAHSCSMLFDLVAPTTAVFTIPPHDASSGP